MEDVCIGFGTKPYQLRITPNMTSLKMSTMKKSIIIWIILGILAAVLLFMPAFS
jgi:hypothetical protein